MVHSCAVQGCTNKPQYDSSRGGGGVSFFKLPKDSDTRQAWFQNLGQVVCPSSKICSDHFKPTCFLPKIHDSSRVVLARGSVPTERLRLGERVEHCYSK